MRNWKYVEVPGRPGMRVEAYNVDDVEGRVSLVYRGSREDMLALGIITEPMLELWKPGTPKGKCDSDGDAVRIERYWGAVDGVPYQRYCMRVSKLLVRAEQVPGAALAIERFRALEIEDEEHRRSVQVQRVMAESSRRFLEAVIESRATGENLCDLLERAPDGARSPAHDGSTLH